MVRQVVASGLLALVLVGVAAAGELTGRVVGVADGDTLTLLTANHQQVRLRLAGIDAPEHDQPFGQKAKQALAALVFNQTVRLDSVLGTPDWREAFYAPITPTTGDLFGDPVPANISRHADVDAIEVFVGGRLRAAGFAKVAEPLRLLLRGGAPLYSLFFCVSNPRAITLSMRAADHLLKAARR